MASLDYDAILHDMVSESLFGMADTLQELAGITDEVSQIMSADFDAAGLSSEQLGSLINQLTETNQLLVTSLDEVSVAFEAEMAAIQADTDQMAGAVVSTEELSGMITQLMTAHESLMASIEQTSMMMDAEIAAMDGDTTAMAANSIAVETSTIAMETESTTLQGNTTAKAENTTATQDSTVAEKEQSSARKGSITSVGLLGLGAAAAGVAMLIMGTKSENALNKVEALAGATAEQMDQYRSGIAALAPVLGKTTAELSDGLYFIASAGYSGSDALNVLRLSGEAAAAGGAKMHDVADGLTSALNAYGGNAADAGKYTDIMVQAVTQGKQEFSAFSRAIGVAAVTGQTTHTSFNQVAAAEALMTRQGLTAHKSVQNLDFMLRAVSLNTKDVANKAHHMGLKFDENSYKSLDLIGRLNYLKTASNGNVSAFEKLVGGTNGLMAAQILLGNNSKDYTDILQAMANAGGSTDKAFEVHKKTIAAASESVAGSFSVLADKLTELVKPQIVDLLTKLGNAFKGMTDVIANHSDVLMPILGGLTTLIGVGLAGAIAGTLGPALMLVASPLGLVVVGAVLLATGFKEAYDHSKPFHDFVVKIGDALKGPFSAGLKDAHEVLDKVSHFVRILADALGGTLKDTVKEVQADFAAAAPRIKELGHALEGMRPIAELIAKILGGALAVAIGIVIGLFQGIMVAVQGVIEVITGIVKIITGVFHLIKGIVTLDGNSISKGIGDIFDGIGTVIHGALTAAIGFVVGFINGVIDWFKHLFDKLIGHSIVTDLMSGIVKLFTEMPGKILGGIGNFVGSVVGHFGDMAKNAISGVGNLKDSVVTHMSDMAKNVTGHVGNLVGGVLGQFTGMKDKAVHETAILKDKAEINALAQKDAVLAKTGQMHAQMAQKYGLMREDLTNQLNNAKTDAERISIGHKLAVVTQHEHLEQQAVQNTRKMHEGIVEKTAQLRDDAKRHAQQLNEGFLNHLSDLPKKMTSLGGNIMSSLASSISGGVGNVLGNIQNLGGSMIDNFKGMFGIHSPSRVFAGFGQSLMEGLAGGIDTHGNTAHGALATVMSGLQPSGTISMRSRGGLGAGAGLTSSGGGEQHIHVHLDGGMGAGLAMLNPTDRTRLVRQIASELGSEIHVQQKLPQGYTGS